MSKSIADAAHRHQARDTYAAETPTHHRAPSQRHCCAAITGRISPDNFTLRIVIMISRLAAIRRRPHKMLIDNMSPERLETAIVMNVGLTFKRPAPTANQTLQRRHRVVRHTCSASAQQTASAKARTQNAPKIAPINVNCSV